MLTIIDQINKQSCPKLDPQIEQKLLCWDGCDPQTTVYTCGELTANIPIHLNGSFLAGECRPGGDQHAAIFLSDHFISDLLTADRETTKVCVML